MITSRAVHEARGGVRAVALGVLVLTATTDATADGESSPMLGAAFVAAQAPPQAHELVGAALEAAWWWGRLGAAAEGAVLWGVRDSGSRAVVLGSSARIRVFDCLLPSLLEPRDVELGIELHGIVEHAWRNPGGSTGYGLGLAARLRGGGDDDAGRLLAESRLFVRVVSAPGTPSDAIARTTTPIEDRVPRELTILFGIGASFGAGERGYRARFHMQPLDVLR